MISPYNPLNEQLEYDKTTGKLTKWYVQPYNKVDEQQYIMIFAMIWAKIGDCDRQMVKSLDVTVRKGEMPMWGQTARFLIYTKQEHGLGKKNV